MRGMEDDMVQCKGRTGTGGAKGDRRRGREDPEGTEEYGERSQRGGGVGDRVGGNIREGAGDRTGEILPTYHLGVESELNSDSLRF